MRNSKGYEENLYTPGCMRLNSGIYLDILNPKPEMFCIEDIAHAAAQIPRFGGHLPIRWSVADHALLCCDLAITNKFECLMHDAVESFLNDCISPIKKILYEYRVLEDVYQEILSKKFGFKWPFSYALKEIDRLVLEDEWNLFLIKNHRLEERHWKTSKELFIQAYEKYKP